MQIYVDARSFSPICQYLVVEVIFINTRKLAMLPSLVASGGSFRARAA